MSPYEHPIMAPSMITSIFHPDTTIHTLSEQPISSPRLEDSVRPKILLLNAPNITPYVNSTRDSSEFPS